MPFEDKKQRDEARAKVASLLDRSRYHFSTIEKKLGLAYGSLRLWREGKITPNGLELMRLELCIQEMKPITAGRIAHLVPRNSDSNGDRATISFEVELDEHGRRIVQAKIR